jgi:hypothetical protein
MPSPDERAHQPEWPRGAENRFDKELEMRKITLVAAAAALIGAGIGIWAALAHVGTISATSSIDKPATAAMSPFEIMRKPGKELPAGQSADPF